MNKENKVMYMCPNCYSISEKPVEHICEEHKFINHSSRGKRNKYEIELDANIAPAISQLNRKGYKTNFCCEGHFDSTHAYIGFDPSVVNKDNIQELLSNLPSWEIDEDTYRNSIEVHIRPKIHDFMYGMEKTEENKMAYEFIKRQYLKQLNDAVYYCGEINTGIIACNRPLISSAYIDKKGRVNIEATFYKSETKVDMIKKLHRGSEIAIANKSGLYGKYYYLDIIQIYVDDVFIKLQARENDYNGLYNLDLKELNDLIGNKVLIKELGDQR